MFRHRRDTATAAHPTTVRISMAKKTPAPKAPTKPKELKDSQLDKAAGGYRPPTTSRGG
jgi:hypothetical protein